MISRKLSFLALLLGFSLLPAAAATESASEGGSYPYFSPEGRLKLMNTDPGMSIHRIKTDGQNRLWTLYERNSGINKNLYLGRITAKGIVQKSGLTHGLEGWFHSPDMDLGPSNRPWVVWVQVTQKKQQLIIKDLENNAHWTLEPPHSSPLFSPKILIDPASQAWLFWVGKGLGLDEIFYSRYDSAADTWSEPISLTPNPSVPHFHPDAALNGEGYPAVVWSEFNGADYDVFYAAWEGRTWTPTEKISRNKNCADAQPSLIFYMDVLPAVAWTHSRMDGTTVLFSYKERNNWQNPISLTSELCQNHSPRLFSQGLNMAISWWDDSRLQARPLSFPPQEKRQLRTNTPWLRIQSPLLEENKFIGFGDSITFGSMNGPTMGTGYTPRLQNLLGALFQEPLVVNRGIPGEPTWEAVSRIHSVLDNDLALYLLLMEGTKDVSTLNYSLDSTIFNLRQILKASLDRSLFPLISTIIPRARDRWTPSAKARTTELNTKIVNLAIELKVFIVQNYDAFINFPDVAGGYEALISGDNLHPNDLGYQVMAETWYQKIKFIPFPPVEIQAKKSQSQQRITLTWEDDPRILPSTLLAQYRIYRTTIAQNSPRPIALVPATTYTYQDTKISLEEEYRYFVSSVSGRDREGPLGEPAIPEQGDPFPPLNIDFETKTNKAYTYWEYLNQITWDANPENQGEFDIVSYRIYRKRRGAINTSYTQIVEVSASEFAYLDRGLSGREEAETYEYTVTSVDSDGQESPYGES
ncbi:MAG: hypothetical protein GQ544_10235 [Candidatus Aminicenantes bacterium]|nr:hypothetical protein [Candidatus Aminicenantes bacterium]